MNTRFEALVKYLLTGITDGILSDAVVYEFIQECYKNIQKELEIPWVGDVEALWNYLTTSRTTELNDGQSAKDAFRQGQVFAAMELVKMMQDRRDTKAMLEQDAIAYGDNWYPIFVALKDGKSLTCDEISDVSGILTSLLLQSLDKIEEKQYVFCRKVGMTKYYRLSPRGQELLKYMLRNYTPRGYRFELRRDFSCLNAVLFPSSASELLVELTEKFGYNDIINSNYKPFYSHKFSALKYSEKI